MLNLFIDVFFIKFFSLLNFCLICFKYIVFGFFGVEFVVMRMCKELFVSFWIVMVVILEMLFFMLERNVMFDINFFFCFKVSLWLLCKLFFWNDVFDGGGVDGILLRICSKVMFLVIFSCIFGLIDMI